MTNEPLLPSLWAPWTAVMERSGSLWGLVQEYGESAEAKFGHALRDMLPAGVTRSRYYNTGVILIHAQRLRQRGLLHPNQLIGQLSASASHGKSSYAEFGLGEQNLLNAWLSDRPELVTSLPCRWNRRIDAACSDPLPGIRHANRMIGRPHDADDTEKRLSALHLPSTSAAPTLEHPSTTASTSTGGRSGDAHVSRAMAPGSTCAPRMLLPELRGNASALAECAFLMAKRVAHSEIKLWQERYHSLPCVAVPQSAERDS